MTASSMSVNLILLARQMKNCCVPLTVSQSAWQNSMSACSVLVLSLPTPCSGFVKIVNLRLTIF